MHREHSDTPDDSLQSESDDGSWAAQIEADIAEDFRADDWKGSKLQDADCRSTLCRLVVAHERPKAADAFVPRMGLLQAFANTEIFLNALALQWASGSIHRAKKRLLLQAGDKASLKNSISFLSPSANFRDPVRV